MFRPRHAFAMLLAALIVCSGAAAAQATGDVATPTKAPARPTPDEVLAENRQTRLIRADYDADIQRVPAGQRDEFASDPKRLSAYLTNLLIVKTLAAEARNEGLQNEPLLQRRIALEGDRLLAQRQLEHIEEMAGKEFDVRSEEFLLKAKELYLVDKNKYRVPEQVRTAHIVFSTEHRTPEEALALAHKTRKKLLDGADFAAMAREVSDDPTAKNNGGENGWFSRDRMDPAFAEVAFNMKNAGDISEPVRSSFGYHLIRFEGRRSADVRSFEAVKSQIMMELRQRYVDEQRDARTNAIRNDPELKVNQPAVDSLLFHVEPGKFGMSVVRGGGKREKTQTGE